VASHLDLLADQITVVIGGAGDYAGGIHVIVPEAHGITVHIIRDGRTASMWGSNRHDMAAELAVLLDHVGGTPAVVTL
jgi:hypothetical protein